MYHVPHVLLQDKDVRVSTSIIGRLFREIGEAPKPPMLSDLAEEMGLVSRHALQQLCNAFYAC